MHTIRLQLAALECYDHSLLSLFVSFFFFNVNSLFHLLFFILFLLLMFLLFLSEVRSPEGRPNKARLSARRYFNPSSRAAYFV